MKEQCEYQFYTVEEIAKILKVSKMTIFRYIKSGKLKAIKVGQWRIKKEDFDKFINK
ncbi:MAG: helix-turn-helix domain-containing protein [Candidatus Falkowbacteria bacterium]|nr:helix-turn-helix domain-containing protein [Candidatus Falkowbacteria bacterium]